MTAQEMPIEFRCLASYFHEDVYEEFDTMEDAVLGYLRDANKEELERLDDFLDELFSGRYALTEINRTFVRAGSSISFDYNADDYESLKSFFKFVREQIARRLAEEAGK